MVDQSIYMYCTYNCCICSSSGVGRLRAGAGLVGTLVVCVVGIATWPVAWTAGEYVSVHETDGAYVC